MPRPISLCKQGSETLIERKYCTNMAVLAASITTRSGKPLLSRQFQEITKERVLELLSNFQSLIAKISSEHTYVEDEHVRYVYKPFDDYYIILITNRQSNIISDLSTLNLFSQTVNSYLSSFDESEIHDNAFEILSSFDEIVVMGHKENLTISQVNTYLSMDSHEERIQEIIERNKESEADAERKRRAKEIARREQERKMGIMPSDFTATSTKFMASNDPNASNAINSYYSHASKAAQQSYYNSQQQHIREPPMETVHMNAGAPSGRGLKLSSRPSLNEARTIRNAAMMAPKRQQPEEEKPANNGILISIKETVNAQINRDGTIKSSELKGVLELRVNDPSLAHASIKLNEDIDVNNKSYQFKTHPNIDKNVFLSSKILRLKSAEKAFPSNDQSLGILRWRKADSSDDSTLAPLEVSTWVTPSQDDDGMLDVTVEFEVKAEQDMTLNEVIFSVPLVTENAMINSESNEFNAAIVGIDSYTGISMKLDSIAAGTSGTFGFKIEAEDEDSLFPLDISFKHDATGNASVIGLAVETVTSTQEDAKDLPFDVLTTFRTEKYVVV